MGRERTFIAPGCEASSGKVRDSGKAVSATPAQNTANKVDKKFEVVDCNSLARSDFYMGHGVWELRISWIR